MYTGFSEAMVSPHGTLLHVPRPSVLPLTSFSARRKNSGGSSRKSLGSKATAKGHCLPGPVQLGLLTRTELTSVAEAPNCVPALAIGHRFAGIEESELP